MCMQKMAGVLLGAVVGDCAGSPYIFEKSERLFDRSREIGWQISTPGIDVELMFASAHTLLRHGFDIDRLFRGYCHIVKGCRDLDIVSAHCFSGDCFDSAAAVEFGALCGNAVIIRQIPLVIYGLDWDMGTLWDAVAEECRLTHSDECVIECAQLYAAALHGVLRGESRLKIWDRLFLHVHHDANYRMLVASYYQMPCCDNVGYNEIQKAVGMALYHFWHDTPYICAIRSAILSGGATDINSAATGALLGGVHGVRAVPKAWRMALKEQAFGDLALGYTRFRQALYFARKVYDRSFFMRAGRHSRGVCETKRYLGIAYRQSLPDPVRQFSDTAH